MLKRVFWGLLLVVTLAACGGESPTKTEPHPNHSETKPQAPAPIVPKPDNLNPWAAFAVGSVAKTKTVVTMTEGGKPTTTASTITFTLKEKTADKAVVEMDTVTMGSQTKIDSEIPLSSAGNLVVGNMRNPAMPQKEGMEDLTVAGKTLHCKWIEVTATEGDPFSDKVWIAQEVPGLVVKKHTKRGGANPIETTIELVEFTAK